MTLGNTLALGLVVSLAACGSSVEVEDDGPDHNPVNPIDDAGEVFADGYLNAPDLDWTAPESELHGGVTGMAFRNQDGQRIPIEGARAILMTSAGTITYETDVTGVFRFDVPEGDYVLLVEANGFWGIQRELHVPPEGLHGFGWEMAIEDRDIEQLAEQVGLPFKTTSGIVTAWFSGAAGGETVHLTVGSDLPVTFDQNQQPVVTNRLLPGGTPMLIFGDVDTGQVRVEAQGNGDQSQCRAARSPTGYWLSLPHVVTYVTVECVSP
jgi:hypothetical protein